MHPKNCRKTQTYLLICLPINLRMSSSNIIYEELLPVIKNLVYRPRKVTIHGTEYRLGAVLYTGFTDDELPVFSSINKIIVSPTNNEIVFLLTKFVTIEFSVHYHAFQLRREVQPQTFLASHEDFLTYLPAHIIYPFGVANNNGACYVAPRYSVPAV